MGERLQRLYLSCGQSVGRLSSLSYRTLIATYGSFAPMSECVSSVVTGDVVGGGEDRFDGSV
jgi:hypothetical protein